MKKILTVLGARPQFIKAAAVSREISKHDSLKEILVHTGQHFDKNMSDIFFDEMSIPKPDYNLNINGMNHGQMTGKMLEGIEEIILKEKPDCLMVYGDTNSTLAGALAASKLHIPVAHIEAGLRSFNMAMPEEINRILTDRISNFLFCPTDEAITNLKNEGFDKFKTAQIIKTGDVMYDAALFYSRISRDYATVKFPEKFALVTIHRAENTDDPDKLQEIIRSLNTINSDLPIVCPLHPRTKKKIESLGITPMFTIIEPVGYFDMLELLKNCKLVMTDSGGLQKEAYFFNKCCVTLRDQTEWVELVESGYNILAGANYNDIICGYQKMKHMNFITQVDLYGRGNASNLIIANLLDRL